MTSWPLLSVITFLPLAGALFIAFLSDDPDGVRNARWVALWTTLIVFAISLLLLRRFDASSPDFQFVEHWGRSSASTAYSISLGVDGISLPFVILTTALMPITILASWEAIQRRVREYMIAFLVLETLMVGTFCALDLVLFYLFFEGGLIPMFLIIGVWGGPRRVYASFKFFLYTLAWLRPDAARHHGDVLGRRYHRHSHASASRLPAHAADLGVRRLPGLVRREVAHVAGTHLAP